MSTVLIAYGSIEGQTRKICQAVAKQVEALGHRALLVDAAEGHEKSDWPNPDAVIVAAPVHEHHFPAAVRRYLNTHRDAASGLPGMFLSVSLAAMSDEASDKADLNKLTTDFVKSAKWSPEKIHHVAGALRYTEYSFLKRFILKQTMKAAGGPTDTAQDFDFTDWEALDDLVTKFVRDHVEKSAAA